MTGFQRIGRLASTAAMSGFLMGGVLALTACDAETARTTEKTTTETPTGTVTEKKTEEIKVDPK